MVKKISVESNPEENKDQNSVLSQIRDENDESEQFGAQVISSNSISGQN